MYGEGISREGEVLELGVIHGVLEKSGAWYIYNGDRLGQGKDNARIFLQERPALAWEIENKVRESLGVRALPPLAADKGDTVVKLKSVDKADKADKGDKADAA